MYYLAQVCSDPLAKRSACSDLQVHLIRTWKIVCAQPHMHRLIQVTTIILRWVRDKDKKILLDMCGLCFMSIDKGVNWQGGKKVSNAGWWCVENNFQRESLKEHPYTRVWFLSVPSVWWRTRDPGDGVCHSFGLCRAAASSLPDHSSVPGGQPGGQGHHRWVGWKGWGGRALPVAHCLLPGGHVDGARESFGLTHLRAFS